MNGYTITELEQSPAGFWWATIEAGGETYKADCRDGSWMLQYKGTERELLSDIAADLQARVKRLKRGRTTCKECAA